MYLGYTHHFGKTVGGIKHLLLTPVCNIKSLTLDPRTGCYCAVEFHEPGLLAPCTFSEDSSCYREETVISQGIPTVVHTLELVTDKTDRESDRWVRQLIETCCCGLAAVITTNNNTRLVVGYSEEHRAERPLRIGKISATSGKKHTDPGNEVISLCSRDTAKARILVGNPD